VAVAVVAVVTTAMVTTAAAAAAAVDTPAHAMAEAASSADMGAMVKVRG
jgi:hypothetical protein